MPIAGWVKAAITMMDMVSDAGRRDQVSHAVRGYLADAVIALHNARRELERERIT